MDPSENIYEQIRLAKELVEDPSDLDSSCRLAELVLAMDKWMVRGGALPKRWEEKRVRPNQCFYEDGYWCGSNGLSKICRYGWSDLGDCIHVGGNNSCSCHKARKAVQDGWG